jgi:hypothetical protein
VEANVGKAGTLQERFEGATVKLRRLQGAPRSAQNRGIGMKEFFNALKPFRQLKV